MSGIPRLQLHHGSLLYLWQCLTLLYDQSVDSTFRPHSLPVIKWQHSIEALFQAELSVARLYAYGPLVTEWISSCVFFSRRVLRCPPLGSFARFATSVSELRPLYSLHFLKMRPACARSLMLPILTSGQREILLFASSAVRAVEMVWDITYLGGMI